MEKIFNFKEKKTLGGAIIFYIVAFVIAAVCAGIAGGIMGGTGNLEYASIAGVIAASLVSAYFSYNIYKDSKKSTLKSILLISGVIITLIWGAIFGLLPIALSTLTME